MSITADPAQPLDRKDAWHQAAVWTAAVAGAFSVVVAGFLVVYSLRSQATEMRDADALKELKTALGQSPKSEELKQQIRDLDLTLRKRFSRNTQRIAAGRYLLLAGVVVLLIALKSAAVLRKQLPAPQPITGLPGEEARRARAARRALAATAVALVAAAAALAVSCRTLIAPEPKGAAVAPFPTDEEIQKNWPRFRGPRGLAISACTNVPTSWNGKTGEGILWKSEVPLSAPSSPVVWGDRVFLTGASKQKLEVYCFDLATGALAWQKPVAGIPGSPPKLPEAMEGVGCAAATPAADGRRFYAIFATGDVAAFDFQGRRVWARNLGVPENGYGYASSLALWHDRLLVLYDQATADDKKSKLIALEAATGKTVWEAKRDSPQTWSTPIVVKTPKGEQAICCGDPWLCGYDPATGRELWRAECLGGEIAPSPVYANGVAFTANAGSYATAVRTDGSGDVTKSHILWRAEDGLPDICSPLATGEFVFCLTSDGLLTCYDAKAGQRAWEKDFQVPFSSSPSLVGDRLYLLGEKGIAIILQVGREPKEIGRADLGEKVRTSPAFLDGRIIIRGQKHLFCIGKK